MGRKRGRKKTANKEKANGVAHCSPATPAPNSKPPLTSSQSAPTFPPPAQGSYAYDSTSPHSLFTRSWSSWDAFKVWKYEEEQKMGFKFTMVKKERGGNASGWLGKKKFVCAYVGEGNNGESGRVGEGEMAEETAVNEETMGKDESPDRRLTGTGTVDLSHAVAEKPGIAIESPKNTGCSCVVIVKAYPDTDEVRGHYESEHSHPLCQEYESSRFVRNKRKWKKKQKKQAAEVGAPADGSGEAKNEDERRLDSSQLEMDWDKATEEYIIEMMNDLIRTSLMVVRKVGSAYSMIIHRKVYLFTHGILERMETEGVEWLTTEVEDEMLWAVDNTKYELRKILREHGEAEEGEGVDGDDGYDGDDSYDNDDGEGHGEVMEVLYDYGDEGDEVDSGRDLSDRGPEESLSDLDGSEDGKEEDSESSELKRDETARPEEEECACSRSRI